MERIYNNNKVLMLLALIVLAVLLLTCSFYGLAETSEARYAEISREMVVTGDYLHPQLLGVYHYHKPPITYWITALGYSIFGINEFGARFFLQIAVVSQLVLIFVIGKLLFGKKVGFLSAVTYLTFPIVLISSRNLTTDAYLTSFIIAAVYSWLLYIKNNNLVALYSFYGLIGLAMLTKGPVALIFIVLFILGYRWQNRLKWKFGKHNFLGLLMCLVISSSWYLVMIIKAPELLDYFFVEQLGKRITSESFNRAKPFWFYIPLLGGLLLPWLIFLVSRSKMAFKVISLDRNDKVLLIASIGCVFLFSVFKTKLIMYLLPMFWMLALFIGHQITKLSNSYLYEIASVFIILSLIMCVSPALVGIVKDDYFNSSIIIWAVVLGALLLIFSGFYLLINSNELQYLFQSLIFSLVMLLISQQVLIQNPFLSNSVRPIVSEINSLNNNDGNGTILVYNYLLSSVPFYTNINTVTLDYDHNTTDRDVQFQMNSDWKSNLVDMKEIEGIDQIKSICTNDKVFVLVRKKRELPNELAFLKTSFLHHIDYPKWILYYNN